MLTDYKIVDDKNIKGFFDEYRFLSNYELTPIWYEGLKYPSVENAFQAAKCVPEERAQFVEFSPGVARKKGKCAQLREDWELVKYDIMLQLNLQKYLTNADFKQRLLATGDKYLEETNHWGDKIWGVCCKTNVGENRLGKMLMKIRELLK